MGKLELFFFGRPQVRQDGQPVDFNRRKDLALLAYLAITRKVHSREALAALFWPEHEPERAFANLRRSIWELNQVLGPGWLEAGRDSVELRAGEGIRLDVEEFRSLVRESELSHETRKQLSFLDQAIAVYPEDFLAGFSLPACPEFEEWQYFEAAGLRRELVKALEISARILGETGDFEKALPHARRWLAMDAYHEPAQRLVMRLLAWSGDRSAAIHQYQDCSRLLEEELGIQPEVETQQLYERIKSGEERWSKGESHLADVSVGQGPVAQVAEMAAEPEKEPASSNLPSPLTPFVGRETDLASLAELLQNPDCRLLTVLGPGGIGKTRLAIQSARLAAGMFADGAFFIPLVGLRSAQSILPAVASALELASQTDGESVEQRLLNYLCDKRVLLVFDNFEHLLAAASVLGDLLEQTQHAKLLVTSRQRLQLQGEWVLEVKGMEYPPDQMQAWEAPPESIENGNDGRFEQYSAIQLFMQCARRNLVGYHPGENDYQAAARIARLVGGMPLALELAAAWVPVLKVSEIADEIGRSLDILDSTWVDAPARQRSMRAAFDYSWNLLSAEERQTFAGCSVFRGGFSRQAAQEILGANLRDLLNLVNKSLVQRTPEGRFEVHELLRQYGMEKLAQNPGLSQRAHDWHSAYYCLALQGWERDLKGSRQVLALEEMRAELGNLQAAWRWAVGQQKIDWSEQAVEGLCLMYSRRGRFEEGNLLCQEAIDALQEVPSDDKRLVLACLYAWQSWFWNGLGRLKSPESHLKQVQDLLSGTDQAKKPAAKRALGLAWEVIGNLAHFAGDAPKSREGYETSLQLFREAGEPYWEALLLAGLASNSMYLEGDEAQARRLQSECLAIERRLGLQFELANALNWFAIMVAFDWGEIEAGARMFQESHDLLLPFADLHSRAVAIDSLAQVAFLTGDIQKDLELRQMVVPLHERLGDRRGKAWAYSNLGETYKWVGDYDHAEILTRRALSVLPELDGTDIQKDLIRGGLGHVLLAGGRLEEAREIFQVGIQVARAGRGEHNVGRELALMSRTELALGEPDLAWQHIVEALQLFVRRHHHHWLLYGLAGLAVLLAERGKARRAVEVYALIEHYPFVASSSWYWQLYGERINAAAAGLSTPTVEAARARGRTVDIWTAVEQLVTEFADR